QQYSVGVPIDREEIKKGDLLFFKGPKSETVGHVGIAITDYEDKLAFIHSSSGRDGIGITIDSPSHPHYAARFLGARRVNNLSTNLSYYTSNDYRTIWFRCTKILTYCVNVKAFF